MLKDIIEELEKWDRDLMVRPGFGAPHSDRGDYSELAFDPTEQATVGEMLDHARSALGRTFEGWKGGEYIMNEWTPCHIGAYGTCGESIGPLTVRLMCLLAVKEKNNG